MFDRHWLGDLALAVLLALPLTNIARSEPTMHQPASKAVAVASADRSPGGRVGVLG